MGNLAVTQVSRVVLLFFLFTSKIAFSADWILAFEEEKDMRPHYEQWVRQSLASEVWVYRNKRAFTQFLDSLRLARHHKEILLGLGTENPSPTAIQSYGTGIHEGYFVSVPREVHQKLSKSFLSAVYATQAKEQDINGYRVEALFTKNLSEMRRLLRRLYEGRPSAMKKALERNVFRTESEFYLPVVPSLDISSAAAISILAQSLADRSSKQSFRLELCWDDSEDLDGLAGKYAFGRDVRSVRQILETKSRRLFGVENKTVRSVPLTEILPSLLRDRLHSVVSCHGPNCFWTVASVTNGLLARHPRRLSGEELEKELRARWKPVREPQPGDAAVMTSSDGRHVHAQIVVAEDTSQIFSISKNGFVRFSPYVIVRTEKGKAKYDYGSLVKNLELNFYRPRSCAGYLW